MGWSYAQLYEAPADVVDTVIDMLERSGGQ